MKLDKDKKILIVGLGVMGGSYAKVLKRFGFHISAITLEQSSIDYAIKENIIDEGSVSLDERMIGDADLVIFALYPHVFVEWIEKNQAFLKSGALITDVTGVKGAVVTRVQSILRTDGTMKVTTFDSPSNRHTASSRLKLKVKPVSESFICRL